MRPNFHLEDFHLIQRCLEGDEEAIAYLQETQSDALMAYLVKMGATPHEAQEIVTYLWADCLVPVSEGRVRIASYDGTCALRTWLNTVALNRLISRKRKEESWGKIVSISLDASDQAGIHTNGEAFDEALAPAGATTAFELVDAPLHDLMRQAIEAAFAECSDEEMVMLQLAHCGGMRLADLAQMWGCEESSMCRKLQRASKGVERRTLRHVREADGWLEVRWEDFLELCRSASPLRIGAR